MTLADDASEIVARFLVSAEVEATVSYM